MPTGKEKANAKAKSEKRAQGSKANSTLKNADNDAAKMLAKQRAADERRAEEELAAAAKLEKQRQFEESRKQAQQKAQQEAREKASRAARTEKEAELLIVQQLECPRLVENHSTHLDDGKVIPILMKLGHALIRQGMRDLTVTPAQLSSAPGRAPVQTLRIRIVGPEQNGYHLRAERGTQSQEVYLSIGNFVNNESTLGLVEDAIMAITGQHSRKGCAPSGKPEGSAAAALPDMPPPAEPEEPERLPVVKALEDASDDDLLPAIGAAVEFLQQHGDEPQVQIAVDAARARLKAAKASGSSAACAASGSAAKSIDDEADAWYFCILNRASLGSGGTAKWVFRNAITGQTCDELPEALRQRADARRKARENVTVCDVSKTKDLTLALAARCSRSETEKQIDRALGPKPKEANDAVAGEQAAFAKASEWERHRKQEEKAKAKAAQVKAKEAEKHLRANKDFMNTFKSAVGDLDQLSATQKAWYREQVDAEVAANVERGRI